MAALSTPTEEVARLLEEFEDILPKEEAALEALLAIPFSDQEQ